jgi:hypothetical protein
MLNLQTQRVTKQAAFICGIKYQEMGELTFAGRLASFCAEITAELKID